MQKVEETASVPSSPYPRSVMCKTKSMDRDVRGYVAQDSVDDLAAHFSPTQLRHGRRFLLERNWNLAMDISISLGAKDWVK